MSKGICLNWLPFDSSHTGASRRALELHRRLPADLNLTAFTRECFLKNSRNYLKNINFHNITGARTLKGRMSEISGSWWKNEMKRGNYGLWVTDTLPVVSMKNKRTCITVHDLRHLASRNYVKPERYLLLNLFMKSSLKKADAVIVVSQWAAEQICEHYGLSSNKVHLIYNAVDPSMRKRAESLPKPFEKPFILSVGHLEPRKNHQTLIRAFARVSEEWPGLLVIAGRDTGTGSQLKSLVLSKGLSDRVLFPGPVQDQELLALYRWCELLVCPSLYEGFGITPLEGFVMGKPVMASDIPPHREVTGNAAYMIACGECMDTAIVEGILELLENSHLKENLIQKGYRRAEMFSWDQSAVKLEKLYRNLLL